MAPGGQGGRQAALCLVLAGGAARPGGIFSLLDHVRCPEPVAFQETPGVGLKGVMTWDQGAVRKLLHVNVGVWVEPGAFSEDLPPEKERGLNVDLSKAGSSLLSLLGW